MDYDWWEGTYEDAAGIGLEITGFDTDRNKHATGKFNWTEQKVAHAILAQHGETCETYKTAVKFLAQAVLMDTADWHNSDEGTDEWIALCEDFLKDILKELRGHAAR